MEAVVILTPPHPEGCRTNSDRLSVSMEQTALAADSNDREATVSQGATSSKE